MAAVVVEALSKNYRVATKKDAGLWSSVRGLFRREYKTVHAVVDIGFSIEPGEMVAFLGPNGAGKTTTLKMLSGLIYPTAGRAEVLGYVPWDRVDDYRRRFALVMGQKNQLWWDLPASESFRLHREIYRIPEADFRRVHDELISLLNLGALVGQPVRELSLGERMKMELVAALLHSPDVLFLDEPTIGLDVVAQANLREFLRDYNTRRGTTVLLTSHYMKDVESLCERAIVINHGRLFYDGSLEGIVSKFSNHKIVTVRFAGGVPEDVE
ncbi:MAG: ABC transporter ATP-binding protein, partial [Planctomycetia bacterium]